METAAAPTKRSFFSFGKKKKSSDKTEPTSPVSLPADDVPTPSSSPNQNATISAKTSQLPELHGVAPLNSSPPPLNPTASSSTKATLSPRSMTGRSTLSPTTSPVLAPRRPASASGGIPSPPRLSTSSSQIFERNVQEHASPNPASPAIPAHIQTDNHIPPVLEASSLAITDTSCGVDEVEIVMSAMHQPAVSISTATSPLVADCSGLQFPPSPPSEAIADDLSTHSLGGIGAAAAADKRRLSFISFADVVQAEQADHAHVAHSHTSSPSRGSPVFAPTVVDPGSINERLGRSPSPIRLGGSPPMIGGLGSGLGGGNGGELTVETMRQALRRSGSGELGGIVKTVG